MDIQSTLTLTIQIIFWAFVTLIIFDFVNGIFLLQPQTVISVQSPVAVTKDIPNPVKKAAPCHVQKFEQLPDPWELQLEPHTTTEAQTVVIPFPALRLLPPAQEVQPQPKRRGRPKKSGDSIQQTAKTESPQKRSRTRKKSA
ncbi:MAG: hypothetical protein AB3A66_30180 (plasmid) [Nodularia sp. CChRGM 3473]